MTDHSMKKNPVSIPHTVWYADDIRRGEREAADVLGLTLYELMLRAGEAAFQVCRSAYPDARHWLVLCGHGNNGGDGYVVARLAKAVGIEVTLLAQESDKPLPEEAALAREAWLNAGGEIPQRKKQQRSAVKRSVPEPSASVLLRLQPESTAEQKQRRR